MSNCCFDKEILSFENFHEFDEFDLILTKRLSKGIIKLVEDLPNERRNSPNYTIYECQKCATRWYLSEPENAWRGFFLKEVTAKIRLRNIWLSEKKNNIGCWVILVITILSILYLIVK